jgi:demethylmenaquinone methyltransferase/2-methoxy-6-polyprenyl-1,4-benzoquinol methylase
MLAIEPHKASDPRARARAAAAGEAGKGAYVREMFDAIAPRYDLLNRVLSFRLDRRWRRRAVAALDVARSPAGRYLDLCAGTLDVARAIAREPGFSGAVVGADFAENMLRKGITNGAGPRRAPIEPLPVVADALRLPLPSGVFAGAVVSFGIRNVTSLEAALVEARRVLEPGARFVVLEFNTPPNRVVRALNHAYTGVLLPRIGRFVSGHDTAYAYLPESIEQFPSVDALAAMMTRAGFRDVTWRPMMFGVVALHVGTR